MVLSELGAVLFEDQEILSVFPVTADWSDQLEGKEDGYTASELETLLAAIFGETPAQETFMLKEGTLFVTRLT